MAKTKSKTESTKGETFVAAMILWYLVEHDVTGLTLLAIPIIVYMALRIVRTRIRSGRARRQ